MTLKQNKLSINLLKYKKPFLMVDVETYGDIKSALPYDISGIVLQNDIPLTKKFCLLDEDILTDISRHNSVYFKDKLPVYFYHLNSNKYPDIDYLISKKYDMLERLNNIITDNGINLIVGFNVNFDYQAINRLYRVENNNSTIKRKWYKILKKNYNEVPKKLINKFSRVNFLDLFYCFVELLKHNKELRLQYFYFCYSNAFYTESGKCISTNEETIHRFFVNYDTDEQHIGYCDCEDELKLWYVLQQLIKTKQFKRHNTLTLNTQVDKSVYFKGGLFSIENVIKELTDNHFID